MEDIIRASVSALKSLAEFWRAGAEVKRAQVNLMQAQVEREQAETKNVLDALASSRGS